MPSATSRAGSPSNPIVATSTSCPWATSSLQSSWDTSAPPPPIGGNSKFRVRIRTETSQDAGAAGRRLVLDADGCLAHPHVRRRRDDPVVATDPRGGSLPPRPAQDSRRLTPGPEHALPSPHLMPALRSYLRFLISDMRYVYDNMLFVN